MGKEMRLEHRIDAELDAALPMYGIDVRKAGEAMARAKRLQQFRRAVVNAGDPMTEIAKKRRAVGLEPPFSDKGVSEEVWRNSAALQQIEFRQEPPAVAAFLHRQFGGDERMKPLPAAKIDNDAAKIEDKRRRRHLHAFFEATHSSTRRSRTLKGSAPPPNTASWKPRISKLSPRSAFAFSRNSRILRMPIL